MDYVSLRRREFQTTLRVLQSYPEDQAVLKPSEKSRSAAELAMTLAIEERVIKALLETGAADPTIWKVERPSTMAAIIVAWQETVAANDAHITRLSADDFTTMVDFYGMQVSLADALWMELLDHIHHRGQFSVYLRLAGAKVPSIYGPSADEPMMLV
jgi:uncharacterized damage-inducible protein DinB